MAGYRTLWLLECLVHRKVHLLIPSWIPCLVEEDIWRDLRALEKKGEYVENFAIICFND